MFVVWAYLWYTRFWNTSQSWSWDPDSSVYPKSEVITLSTGSMVSSIKLAGTSKLENEQTLKFAKFGKITGIYVKPGMRVQEWQLLAVLDMSEIESKIQKAKTAYSKAQRNLADLLDGKGETEVLSAKYAVRRAEIDLGKAQDNLKYAISIKDIKLADLQSSIDFKKKAYLIEKEKQKLNANIYKESLLKGEDKVKYDNAQRDYLQEISTKIKAIETLYYSLNTNLDEMDVYLGVKKNLSWKLWNQIIYFWAKNPNYRTLAKQYLWECYSLLNDLKKKIDVLKDKDVSLHDTKDLIPLYQLLKKYYDTLYKLWDNYYLAAKNSVDTADFSESTISSLEWMWTNARNSWSSGSDVMQKTIDELQGQLSLWNTEAQKKIAYLDRLKEYEEKNSALLKVELEYKNSLYTLEQEEKNLARDIEEKELEVKTAKNSLKDAQEKFKEIQKGYTNDELENARNLVEDQKKNLEAVESERNSYSITATFDWTVRRVDMQVGDNLLEGDGKTIILENRDIIKVEMRADQSDILKLKKWQDANIKFDAFPDVTFRWKITEVNETPQRTENIVKYQVIASVKNLSGTKIFSDMSALVDVIISGQEWIPIVPITAVGYDDQWSYVLKASDNTKIYVTVWTQSSETIQIISGLDMSTQIKSTVFNPQSVKEMGIVKKEQQTHQNETMESFEWGMWAGMMY